MIPCKSKIIKLYLDDVKTARITSSEIVSR